MFRAQSGEVINGLNWIMELHSAIQNDADETRALGLLKEAFAKNYLKFHCSVDEARSLLTAAVRFRKFNVVYNLLIVGQVDIRVRKIGEPGVLEWAIFNQDIKMILLLLEQGADIHFADPVLLKDPMDYALDTDNLEIVQLLVRYDADIAVFLSKARNRNLNNAISDFLANALSEEKELAFPHPLFTALSVKKDEEAVQTLNILRRPVDSRELNVFYSFGAGALRLTPLMTASMQGKILLVEKFLQLGANPQIKTRGGKSALHFAAEFGRLEIVECLLKQGVNPCDPVATHGMIPLHFALKNEHFPVVQVLAKRYPHTIFLKCRNDFERTDGFSLFNWRGKAGTQFAQSMNQLLFNLAKEIEKAHAFVSADASTSLSDIEDQAKQASSYKKNGNTFYSDRIMQALEENDDGDRASVLLDEARCKFDFMNAVKFNFNFPRRDGQGGVTTYLVKAIQNRKNKFVFKLNRHFTLNVNFRLENKPSPLSLAILNQDVTLIQYLISVGANPNLFEEEIKKFPLHYAIETGNLDVVKEIIQRGAELHLASFVEFSKTHHFPEISDYLEEALGKQTRLFAKKEDAKCSELAALMSSSEEVILQSLSTKISKELINLYYDFGVPDGRMTLFMYAAKKGFLQLGKKLIGWGADPHLKDSYKRTALHIATRNQHIEFVKWLLFIGLKPTNKTVAGGTPLHVAFQQKYLDMAVVFIRHNPYLIFENSKYFFDFEHESFYERITKKATSFDAAINPLLFKIDQERQEKHLPSFLAEASRMAVIAPPALPIPTPSVKTWKEDLLSAIREKTGGARAACLLLELRQFGIFHSKSIMTEWFRDEQGNLTNFFLETIKHRKYAVVDFLLSHFKIDIDSRRPGCLGALELAILSRDRTILERLLLDKMKSVDVNFYDAHFGKCPLHYAIESGNIRTVESLVQAGALVVSRYSYPDYASMLGFSDIAEYLQLEMDRQAIYYRNSDSKRCRDLISLMSKSESEILKNLLTLTNESEINLFYDFESVKYKKITLLMYAVLKGMFEVVKLLIRSGADVNLKDPGGRSAMHFAALCGNTDCIQLFLKKGGRSVVEQTYKRKYLPLHCAYQNKHIKAIELLIKCNPPTIFTKNLFIDLRTEDFALYDMKDKQNKTSFDRSFNQLMLKLEAEKVISFSSATVPAANTGAIEADSTDEKKEEDEMQVDVAKPSKKRRKKRQLDDDDFELEKSSTEKEASPILQTPSVTRFNHARVVNWVKTLCGDQTFKHKKDCFFYANAIVKCIATGEDPEKWLETKNIATQFDTMNFYSIVKQENGSAYGAVTYSYLPEISDELPVMMQRDIPLTAEKDALDLEHEGDFFRLDNYVLEASDVSTLNETLIKKAKDSPCEVSYGFVNLHRPVMLSHILKPLSMAKIIPSNVIEFKCDSMSFTFRVMNAEKKLIKCTYGWDKFIELPIAFVREINTIMMRDQYVFLIYFIQFLKRRGHIPKNTLTIVEQPSHQVAYFADAKDVYFIECQRYLKLTETQREMLEEFSDLFISSDITSLFPILKEGEKVTLHNREEVYTRMLHFAAFQVKAPAPLLNDVYIKEEPEHTRPAETTAEFWGGLFHNTTNKQSDFCSKDTNQYSI